MMLRRAVALGVVGSVGLVSGCAGGGERETVVVTSTQWVDPDSGAVVESAEAEEAEESDGEAAAEAEAPADATEDAPVVVDSNGDLLATGNVEAWSTEQARKGRPAPNNEDPDNVYYVLVFDSPVNITAIKAGSQVAQESPFAQLGSVQHWDFGTSDHTNGWDEYVGKRVQLRVPPNQFSYSSDVSLPFGSQLMLNDNAEVGIEVLN
ncbi:hypothetical protein HMPREF3151_08170 [Corynebacterium sp. HMSC05H05]|uniref:hypothetical protein n=1 Tax=Corynebacterium sp. HMSC05H05 TaxID=1581119 RepID=UPI0008A3B119|nr:hypothetical protein [Corynebacterium sp. HMSC05H05]OFT57164.1 hypothetical protein HMPREF3151_08170 [Corynebacterium sp. HMSC05H05]